MMNATISKRDCIKKVSFFSDLTDQQADEIAAGLLDCRFNEGQTIFSHGEEGDALYIITEGTVELFIHDYAGEKIILKVVAPGDYFGELAVLGGVSRTATAVALESCMCYELTRNQMLDFLHRKPNTAIKILASFSKTISKTNTMLSNRVSRHLDRSLVDGTTLGNAVKYIVEFCGTVMFVFLNILLFAVWVIWNAGITQSVTAFDPYPFNLLVTIVSIEAVFLIIFLIFYIVRESALNRAHTDIEYEVSLKSELEIANLHEKMELYHQENMKYFEVLLQSKEK
jgi:CRP-like cAMP-binding protein